MRPSHLDAVGRSIVDRPLGLAPVDDRPLSEHREPMPGADQRRSHLAGEADGETRFNVPVGSRESDRVDRSAHNGDQVHEWRHVDGDLGADVGDDAGPRGEFIDAEAQSDDRSDTDRRSHCAQHLTQEPQTIAAVVVATHVREPTEELSDQ